MSPLEESVEPAPCSDEEVKWIKSVKRVPWQTRPDKEIVRHAKRFRQSLCCEEHPEEALREPDLLEYLRTFGLTRVEMIGLSRSFANNLAQVERVSKRKTVASLAQKKIDIDLVDDE